MKQTIEAKSGIFKSSVSKNTDYLIVGNAGNRCWAYSCYGRKIEEAMDLRKSGAKVQIVNEVDFWNAILDSDL
jgi:NAD-dependent DNA ligase